MAQAEEIRTETGPLEHDYTEKEVELCQENLQNHKACSPDKIKNEMLKPTSYDLQRRNEPEGGMDVTIAEIGARNYICKRCKDRFANPLELDNHLVAATCKADNPVTKLMEWLK
eukprot:g1753.t1